MIAFNEKHLLSTLNQAQQEDYEKIKGQWEEMDSIADLAAFKASFRLAVQLMIFSG